MVRQDLIWGREPFDLEGVAEWVISTAEKICDEVAKLLKDRHRLIVSRAILMDDLDVTALGNHVLKEDAFILHAIVGIDWEKTDEDETDKENDKEGENHEEQTLADVLQSINRALVPEEVHESSSKPF
jgi:hypothetical protein